MALRLDNQLRVDLNFAYSDTIIPEGAKITANRTLDLSNVGLVRNKFKPHQQLLYGGKFVYSFPSVPDNSGVKEILGNKTEANEPYKVTIKFHDEFILGAKWNNAQKQATQQALQPVSDVTLQQIANSEFFNDAIKTLKAQVKVNLSQMATAINVNLANEKGLLEQVKKLLDFDENATVAEVKVNADELDAATYAEFTALCNGYSHIFDRTHIDRVSDWKFWIEHEQKLDPITEATVTIGAIAGKMREKLSTKAFELPLGVTFEPWAWQTTNSFQVIWENAEEKPGTEMDRKDLAFYIHSLAQTSETDQLARKTFAMCRTLVWKHGLFLDSEETHFSKPNPEENKKYVPSADDLKGFDDLYANPERYFALALVSAISFLKSGHHATAYGLPNQLSRVLNALQDTVDPAQIGTLIRAGVYHGFHVASMRQLIAYIKHLAKTGELSGAIAYRLNAVPPMFAGYANLALVIEALNKAKFFEYTNNKALYIEFMTAYTTIREKMHYCAPYSKYLYGRYDGSLDKEKEICTKMAAFASAIDSVMPTSTLRESPSLRKLVSASTSNDLVASLLVEGYITAFRKYFRTGIENAFNKKVDKGESILKIEL